MRLLKEDNAFRAAFKRFPVPDGLGHLIFEAGKSYRPELSQCMDLRLDLS